MGGSTAVLGSWALGVGAAVSPIAIPIALFGFAAKTLLDNSKSFDLEQRVTTHQKNIGHILSK